MGIHCWIFTGSEYFRDNRPESTMVEISKLIEPEFVVEIEAEAIFRNN
jgi:hypothetical protein